MKKKRFKTLFLLFLKFAIFSIPYMKRVVQRESIRLRPTYIGFKSQSLFIFLVEKTIPFIERKCKMNIKTIVNVVETVSAVASAAGVAVEIATMFGLGKKTDTSDIETAVEKAVAKAMHSCKKKNSSYHRSTTSKGL